MGIDAETYAAAKAYVDKEVEGGGGTLDYEALRNHPSINGNELVGNKSSKQLGMQNLFTGTTTEWAQLTADQKAQYTHVCFTDDTSEGGDGDMKKSVYDSDLAVANAGGISAFVSDAISGKVDKVAGKGLSTNDYDNTEKGKVADNTGAIEAIVNEYGAKNLAPTLDFTQKVDNDITWTVIRENGSNNGKVTVVGTSSGWSVMQTKDFYLPAGTYVISDGASSRNTYVELKKSSDASKIVNTADGDSQTFTLSQDATVYVLYAIRSGVTVNDVFACMLRDARITDPTYVPYAMTNRELTERVVYKKTVTVTTDSNGVFEGAWGDLDFPGQEVVNIQCDSGNRPLLYFVNYNSTRTRYVYNIKAWVSDFTNVAPNDTLTLAIFTTKS